MSGGGTNGGGAEPFANAAYRKRLAGHIVTNQRPPGSVEYFNRSIEEPACTLTTQTQFWSFSRQDAPGPVRVTAQEAAVLQSFRPDYPWQGNKTRQHEQIGNAVPPLLAAHVLAATTGVHLGPLATPTMPDQSVSIMAVLTGAIVASADTDSESSLARRAGVTRVTVRRALGK